MHLSKHSEPDKTLLTASNISQNCYIVQIAYLDNLNFGEFSTAQIMKPRVQSFTKEMMDKLTQMDKVHNAINQECKFGKRKVSVIR